MLFLSFFDIELVAGAAGFFGQEISAVISAIVKGRDRGLFEIAELVKTKVDLCVVKINGPNRNCIASNHCCPQKELQKTIRPPLEKATFSHAPIDAPKSKYLQKYGQEQGQKMNSGPVDT